jgi:hypothetical protein
MGGADTSNPQAGAMSSMVDYNNMLKSDQQWNTLGSIVGKGVGAFGKRSRFRIAISHFSIKYSTDGNGRYSCDATAAANINPSR